jgi:hypothetical protein
LSKKQFEKNGFFVFKDFIPKELALFLSDYLHVMKELNKIQGKELGDDQIPDAKCIVFNDPALESLYLRQTKKMEEATGYNLIPTYIYARIYGSGNILHAHKDRPSCEISASIKLNESEGYIWPIAVEDKYIELDIGDAVIYKGCEVLHWRDKCEGEKDYFLSQMFMHFVDANGQYSDYKYDRDNVREFIFETLFKQVDLNAS